MEDARQRQAEVILAMHNQDLGHTGDAHRPIEALPQETSIERVPPEILSLFFIFAKPSDLADCIPSRRRPPLTFLQVCSLWRTVALATPDLWTDLCISLRGDSVQWKPAALDKLATQWFSLAGPHTRLSLQFEDYISPNHIYDFSNIILSRSERFRQLKISFLITSSLAAFIRGDGNASSTFSQLEDLTIPTQREMGIRFAAAGCLRRMTLGIYFHAWEGMKSFAPWEQLTYLEIGFLPEAAWVSLLSQCINLETGTFTIRTCDIDPIPTVNVTMAHLTSLNVRFSWAGPSSVELFDGFRFPVLTSLHMEPERDFSWRHPEHFYDQLGSLRTLSFVGTSVELVNLLRHTPSLVALHATTNTHLDPLLLALTATNESDPLVPELKQLTIQATRWTVSTPSGGPLVTMIASRTRYSDAYGCQLEHLTVVVPIVERHGDDSLELGRQLRELDMSMVREFHRLLSGSAGGGTVVEYVWRQAGSQASGSTEPFSVITPFDVFRHFQR